MLGFVCTFILLYIVVSILWPHLSSNRAAADHRHKELLDTINNLERQKAPAPPPSLSALPTFNIGGGAALRTGADVFNKASAAVQSELSDAVSDLRSRVQLPTDADNVLNGAMRGQQPTPRDYDTLSQAVQGDPQANNVMSLVRQAHVASIVEDSGTLTGKKFTGGLSSLPTLLNSHVAEKAGLAALMTGAAIEGGAGHLITYSPQAIAALAGVAGAARLAEISQKR